MTVGERIAARRKELNMTQEELAKKLGYKSRSSINKIELEWSNVPLSKLEKVADALDCEATYLMGWAEMSEPETTWYLTHEEEALLRCWRQATDEQRENVAFIFRDYGMPRPIPRSKGEGSELSTLAGGLTNG